jgi:hypothetical protein
VGWHASNDQADLASSRDQQPMILATYVETEHARPWKRATGLFALIGIAAAWWAHTESRRADELEQQVSASRTELAAAREAVRQAEKRDLPLSVSYSAEPASSKLVAVVKSDFPRPLQIVALFTGAQSTERKRFNLTIPPRGQIELGGSEGWNVTPGSRIVLYNGAFRPAEYVVPNL